MKKILIFVVILAFLLAGVDMVSAAGCNPFVVATGGTGGCTFTGVVAGNGTNPLYATATGTVSGTTNQISVSGTPYVINGNTTLSLPSLVILTNLQANSSTTLQAFTFTIATGTSATTTNFFSTTASSSNLFGQLINGFGLTSCTGTNAITWTGGSFSCTAQPQGTVTSIAVTTANGVSGSSSGGATPSLTITLGDITPSSVVSPGVGHFGNLWSDGSSTLQAFTGTRATTTSATTTSLFATTASSTNLFSGSVSIATSSFANKYQLEQGTETASFQLSHNGSSTPSFIVLGTNGNGNVGIGTTTPVAGLSLGTTTAITTTEYNVSTTTTMLINWKLGNQQSVQIGTGATHINFATTTITAGMREVLVVCNPSTGTAGTITWDSQILWAGGTVPTQTTTATHCDVWSFLGTRASSTAATIPFGTAATNF